MGLLVSVSLEVLKWSWVSHWWGVMGVIVKVLAEEEELAGVRECVLHGLGDHRGRGGSVKVWLFV